MLHGSPVRQERCERGSYSDCDVHHSLKVRVRAKGCNSAFKRVRGRAHAAGGNTMFPNPTTKRHNSTTNCKRVHLRTQPGGVLGFFLTKRYDIPHGQMQGATCGGSMSPTLEFKGGHVEMFQKSHMLVREGPSPKAPVLGACVCMPGGGGLALILPTRGMSYPTPTLKLGT